MKTHGKSPEHPTPPDEELEVLLAKMRTPESVAGAQSLFSATSQELSESARHAAIADQAKTK